MSLPQPIKIAILAMGGEGGAVLADWIVDLAEHNNHLAQTTSVPGVAQRTGATIYYLELFPQDAIPDKSRLPVLALMPLPGDVDVVLASELMEAGRAVQRGLVTRERTTLIGSSHRVYAISEKSAMGDGRIDSEKLNQQVDFAAKRFIRFDMAQVAEDADSIISAVLFGALCASGVLPFKRAQFEDAVSRGGAGTKASLKAFSVAHDRVIESDRPATANLQTSSSTVPRDPAVKALLTRVRDKFHTLDQATILEGVRRLLEYQDAAYANQYLDRLTPLQEMLILKKEFSDAGNLLLREAARHLALWMSFEDIIRVADLKTRASRFDRVHKEVKVAPDQLLDINEFMHPRLEEVSETLPAGMGRWLMRPHAINRWLRAIMSNGRVVTTSSLGGFVLLWSLARLRVWRRGTLRYQLESERIERWLDCVKSAAQINPELALEVAKCQGLVKGYGDTHARGLCNFLTLMQIVRQQGYRLAPAHLKGLRDAALADEQGKELDKVLKRLSPLLNP